METTYYFAKYKNGDYIFDNFPNELKYLIIDFKENREPIKIEYKGNELKARLGLKVYNDILIYVITTDSKFVNRLKFFRELLEFSPLYVKPIIKLKRDLIEAHQLETEEFIHNVTSLNTYGIQDFFSLIPQKLLTENINKQKATVRELIDEKPNVTVDTLLRLIKYNLATKVEFSVFERTVKNISTLQKEEHSIRSVVLSILQIFIDDFDKKYIEVTLSASDKVLEIDYDSIFVSLYYIFDNAVKYCCPRTKFKIIFSEEKKSFDIIIIMVSIRIEEKEKDLLTERGYRSERAKKLNTKGLGIGMYRILKTLKLNNAELKITPRINNFTNDYKETRYEGNEFRIIFTGQNDWFI